MAITPTYIKDSNEVFTGTKGVDYFENQKGANVTINAGAGNDSISNLSGTNNGSAIGVKSVLNGEAGNDTIRNFADSVTMSGGDGNDTLINESGSYVLIDGGSGNDDIRLASTTGVTSSNVTVKTGAGTDTVTVFQENTPVTIVAGSGSKLINFAKSTSVLITGDTVSPGNKTLNFDYGSTATVTATIEAGEGDDTIRGVNGSNLFKYNDGDGNDVILNYSPNDTIQLSTSSFDSYNLGGDVILKVGSGTIKVKNAANHTIKVKTSSSTAATNVTASSYADDSSPQDVIKNLISSIESNSDSLSGTKLLDAAIKEVTSSKYKTVSALITQFLKDAKKDNFLEEYCGIILDNEDTGAITGYDAGGSTAKTANNVVAGQSSTDNSLTVNYADGVSGTSLASSLSRWIAEGINLNDESYGLEFSSVSSATMNVSLSSGLDSLTVAQVNWGSSSTNGARNLSMALNSSYASTIGTDTNGSITLSNGTTINLDRVIAHEMNHAAMASNVSGYEDLPLYFKEGLADLTHGIDDQRKSVIKSLIGTKSTATKALKTALSTSGSGENAYAAGYMLLRYLARQFATSTDDTSELEGTVVSGLTYSSDYTTLKVGTAYSPTRALENYGAIVKTINASAFTSKVSGLDIIANDLDQSISGSKVADTIDGGTGNNTILGNAGNDIIYGYNHTVNGADAVSSDDFLSGGAGNDTIYGGGGADTLDGGAGNDILYGGDGDDSLSGGAGADSLYGGAGNDTFTGGAGNDIFFYGGGKDVITDYGTGTDTINTGSYKITNSALDTDVTTTVIFTLGSGTDNVIKVLKGSGKKFTFVDSDGSIDSAFSIYYGTSSVKVSNSDDANEDFSPNSAVTLVDASSRSKAVTITGNSSGNTIKGGKAADSLTGGAGADYILGNAGNDTLNGVSVSGGGSDTLTGGAGNDVFDISNKSVKSIITDFSESGSNGTDSLYVGSNKLSTLSNVDNNGDGGSKATNVRFNVGDGQVTLKGAKNKRIYVASDSGDSVGYFGGDSVKLTNTDNENFNVFYTVANDPTSTLEVNLNSVVTIDGSSRTKAFQVTGKNNGVLIKGGSKNDTLYGTAGEDTLIGGKGNDYLSSTFNTNVLDGGDGNDTLYAGQNGSPNSLTGGKGDDVFVFKTKQYYHDVEGGDSIGGNNVILDYSESGTYGADKILFYGNASVVTAAKGNATVDDNGDVNFNIDSRTLTISKAKGKKITFVDENDSIISSKYYGVSDVTISSTDNGTVDVNNEENEDIHIVNASKRTKAVVIIGGSNDTTQAENTLQGGTKNDSILAGTTSNYLIGNAGNDTLNASQSAKATLDGGAGNDVLIGNTSSDAVTAIFDGGAGNDKIYTSHGNNTVTGGKGNDTVFYSGGDVLMNDYSASGTNGADMIYIGENTILSVDTTNETITAFEIGTKTTSTSTSSSSQTKVGTIKLENVAGKKVTFLTVDSADTDTIVTTAQVYGSSELTVVNADGNLVDLTTDWNATVTSVNASKRSTAVKVIGNAANDTIKTGSKADTVDASKGGANYILTAAGNDSVLLGNGDDTVDLGAGNDTVNATLGGNNYITGGKGNDLIISGSTGSDTFVYTSGDGNDTIQGYTPDSDVIKFGSAKTTINMTTSTVDTDTSSVILVIGSNKVSLEGTYNKNITIVDGKDDTVTYNFTDFDTTVIDTSTTIHYASTTALGMDYSDNTETALHVIANALNNTITANSAGPNTIEAGAGNDVVYGGGQGDSIIAGAGNDIVDISKGGNNYVTGDAGNDSILAGSGDDTLYGGAGNDTINASLGGDNYIVGGAGNDYIISSNTGSDTFVYTSGDGNDTIEGYVASTDIIKLGTKATAVNVASSGASGDDFILVVGSGKITLKDAASDRVVVESYDGRVHTTFIPQVVQVSGGTSNVSYSVEKTKLTPVIPTADYVATEAEEPWFAKDEAISSTAASTDDLDSILSESNAVSSTEILTTTDELSKLSQTQVYSPEKDDKK